MKALGIDIGGTKISYCLINEKGEILSDIEKISTPKTKDEIEKELKNIISKYENEVEFSAIATAGTVNNSNTKVIGSTANLPSGYKDIDFQGLSNKKVFLENDANCAAIAEAKIGAAKDTKDSITLTLGTGVGGGIIIDGKLLKGKSGAAGEMHFPMSRTPKRSCTCGFYDCYEAYASGNGLRRTGIEISKNPDITTYDIIAGVKNNDTTSKEILDLWLHDIALGIVGLVNIFDTEVVVLSGSMGEFADTEKIEDFVNKNIVTTKVKIKHAKLSNHCGMIGAVLLGFDKIK